MAPGVKATGATAVPASAPLTSVMRSPNCSSMTTTSPRAIGRPLTSRSTGLSARGSSVTTDPGPRLMVSPSCMRVRPTSTVSSTVTSVRRVRSASTTGPRLVAASSPKEFNLTSVIVRASSSSYGLLDGDVGEQHIVHLNIGVVVDDLEDLLLQ